MKTLFLFPLLIIGIANARPQDGVVNEDFETLTDGVEQLGKDISKVVDSKTGALVFIGGNAFNYTVDAAGAVSSGVGQASNYLNGITLEGLQNGTISAEEAIKIKKIAMIQALFDAKRQVLNTLNAVGTGIHDGFGQFSDSLNNLYNSSLGQINIAINTTSIFTFETIPTTLAWDNIINSLGGTWNATSTSVANTADSLIGTLLSVKEQMHNTLENFDSQESLSHHTNTIADKLNATMIGISGFGAQLGVFDALDNIMGGVRNVSMGLAVIPEKVSLFLNANPVESEEEEEEKEVEEKVKEKVKEKEKEKGKEKEKEKDLAQSKYDDYEIFAEDSDDEFFQRETRSIDSVEDIPMEELDTILKKELEFWNTVNDIFKRQNRMIKNNVPK